MPEGIVRGEGKKRKTYESRLLANVMYWKDSERYRNKRVRIVRLYRTQPPLQLNSNSVNQVSEGSTVPRQPLA